MKMYNLWLNSKVIFPVQINKLVFTSMPNYGVFHKKNIADLIVILKYVINFFIIMFR